MADLAARGRNSRNRGARAEVAVVNWLRTQGWPDARRYLAGDGRQPGDIDFHPLIMIEVKDRAASAWPSWCRQADEEAPDRAVPVVVRRERGVPDVGSWWCRMRANDYYSLDGPEGIIVGIERVDDDVWVQIHMAEFVRWLRQADAEPA